VIPLPADREIGPTLRQLRLGAGLTIRQLARRAHISPNGVHKREASRAGYLAMLAQHVGVLGYTVALIPHRDADTRDTGTGWPA
jgi:transcriptional regulator with XRE-family HTH domain